MPIRYPRTGTGTGTQIEIYFVRGLLIAIWLFLSICIMFTARGGWEDWIEFILITLALAGLWWRTIEEHRGRQRSRDGDLAKEKDQSLASGRQ
jgi:hypothetical protein